MVAISQQKNKNINNSGILSYDELISFIENSWNNQLPISVERFKTLDKYLGNPSQKFKSIIVAGDNGKSLTANFISQLLNEEKVNNGAYYSPHIRKYNERFSIGNITLSNNELCEFGNEVFQAVNFLENKDGEKFHATEILSAISYVAFARKNVTSAVIEAGNNPKIDPAQTLVKSVVAVTRLCNESDESTIKNISEYLDKNSWLVSADQNKANLALMETAAQDKKARWAMPIRKLAALPYPFEQLHGRCAALAERASQLIMEDVFGEDSNILDKSLLIKPKGQRGRPTLEAKLNLELNPKRTVEEFWSETTNKLSGRFEFLKDEKPMILLDNASNIDAFNNLFLGIRLLHYSNQIKGLTIIIGCDNNTLNNIEFLKATRYFFKKTSGQVIFCPTSKNEFNVEKISEELRGYKVKSKSAESVRDAYSMACKAVDAKNGLIVVCGSNTIIQDFSKIMD